jgi:hypothetical protein
MNTDAWLPRRRVGLRMAPSNRDDQAAHGSFYARLIDSEKH